MQKIRCSWAKSSLMTKYHDEYWGKINKDERYLFKMLCLEGMQSGLSWEIILRKEADYEQAFYSFDINKVANLTDDYLLYLLTSESKIIKHKLKVFAIRSNAQAFLKIQNEFDRFATYIWRFVDNKQIVNNVEKQEDLAIKSEISEKISKDLKRRGFKFVGPVIIYSYMQAIGMVNDHLNCCAFK